MVRHSHHGAGRGRQQHRQGAAEAGHADAAAAVAAQGDRPAVPAVADMGHGDAHGPLGGAAHDRRLRLRAGASGRLRPVWAPGCDGCRVFRRPGTCCASATPRMLRPEGAASGAYTGCPRWWGRTHAPPGLKRSCTASCRPILPLQVSVVQPVSAIGLVVLLIFSHFYLKVNLRACNSL